MSQINIEIEENTKKEFEKICYQLGMDVNTACNIFIKAVIRQKMIPFIINSSVETDRLKTLETIKTTFEKLKNDLEMIKKK